MAEFDDQGRPIPPQGAPAAPPPPSQPAPVAGFSFNRPTVVSLLYLASCVLMVSGIVGLVLAYVWRNEPHEEWKARITPTSSARSGSGWLGRWSARC